MATIVTLPTVLSTGLNTFPATKFQGLKLNFTRNVEFENTISRAASGREVGVSWREMPIITLELSWDFLDANPDTTPPSQDGSVSYTDLDWLDGFFRAQHGDLIPFYLRVADLPGQSPTDSQGRGQQIGTGDGTTVNFQLCRTVGPYLEPVQTIDSAVDPIIYFDGLPATGWTMLPKGIIQFTVAPANGTVITADFNWLYLCRFNDPAAEFEQFAYLAHECKSLKLRTVIQ